MDWRLRRPSRAEATGAVKAVGGGTAGAAGALPAQHLLLEEHYMGPDAGRALPCEGQWEGVVTEGFRWMAGLRASGGNGFPCHHGLMLQCCSSGASVVCIPVQCVASDM